jgi:hypothetical protein
VNPWPMRKPPYTGPPPKPFLLGPLWNNVWLPISLRKLASNRPCSFGWLSTLS